MQAPLLPELLHNVAQLAVVDVFPEVVRTAPAREFATLLRGDDGLGCQEPDLAITERSGEGGNAPLTDREPTGHVGEDMDAVADVLDSAEKAEARKLFEGRSERRGDCTGVDDTACPGLRMELFESLCEKSQTDFGLVFNAGLCVVHAGYVFRCLILFQLSA